MKRSFQQLPLEQWPHQLRAWVRPGTPANHRAPKNTGAPERCASVLQRSRSIAPGAEQSDKNHLPPGDLTRHTSCRSPTAPDSRSRSRIISIGPLHPRQMRVSLVMARHTKVPESQRSRTPAPANTLELSPLIPQAWTQGGKQKRIAAGAHRLPGNTFPGRHDKNKLLQKLKQEAGLNPKHTHCKPMLVEQNLSKTEPTQR